MHEKRIEIRWKDVDMYGHVNQAVYLTYAEEVLDDWVRRTLGLGGRDIWHYVGARAAIDFRNELRFEDRYAVGSCRLARLGNSSVTVRIELRAPDGRLVAEVELVAVTFDPKRRKSRPLTDEERAAFERG